MPQIFQLHAQLIIFPPPLDPNLLAVKLISISGDLSHPRHAALVFTSLGTPNIIACNALLKSLSQNKLFVHTLHQFNLIFRCNTLTSPDEFTFTSVLKSAAALAASRDGEMAHAFLLRRGLHSNIFVANSLVDLYFKVGRTHVARNLFEEMTNRDIVSYNTLITGLSSSGEIHKAREVFNTMDKRSFVSWSAMISGHARSGDIVAARELFDQMPERNVICWNAMIAGYAQNEKFGECIELFRMMLRSAGGLQPNDSTLVNVLSACANLGTLELGKWIEGYINRRGMAITLFLGNALSDMYSKCGCIEEARRVFDSMNEKDVISWSIIISGLAMHGHAGESISAFDHMLKHNIKPNEITFMGVLSACTHSGLVDLGLDYFRMMVNKFGVEPKVEHYGCIVDLLSKSGRLDEAELMIKSMKVQPNVVVWGSLLGGCQIYKDTDRGERVVEHILELDPEHTGSYVYLANVYSSLGKLEDAAKCRLRMRRQQLVKTPGCSWIEVDNTVFEFFKGDRSHPHRMISELGPRMKLAGYVPNTSVVSQSIHEEEKEDTLLTHSEKLAVVYGLISTKEGATIRVVKNLRICNDCHEFMKVMSRITKREIILRDRSRFHHFREGLCSCKEYW